MVVGRATARPAAGEMAVGAPRSRARAIKWTGTGGRACRRMCRRAVRARYMASARYSCAGVSGATSSPRRAVACRVDSQQRGAVQSSQALSGLCGGFLSSSSMRSP